MCQWIYSSPHSDRSSTIWHIVVWSQGQNSVTENYWSIDLERASGVQLDWVTSAYSDPSPPAHPLLLRTTFNSLTPDIPQTSLRLPSDVPQNSLRLPSDSPTAEKVLLDEMSLDSHLPCIVELLLILELLLTSHMQEGSCMLLRHRNEQHTSAWCNTPVNTVGSI